MKRYFNNPDTGLLRAGWRLLAFFVFLITTTAVAMIGVRAILGSLKKGSVLQFTILAVSATVAVFVARRYLDKKSFVSLGLRFDKYAVLDVISGIVNSALVMATMFIVLLSLGLIDFKGFTWWMDGTAVEKGMQLAAIPVALTVVFELSVVAWWEELVFRGYFFQNLVPSVGLKWSIVISSLAFGFIHATNPNATILSSLMIAFITPQLIYAYLKTGHLWLPMGIHLGWNFFQASVFGFAASGQDSPSLIAQTPTGPEWLSGGEFGAEGSMLILPVTALSLLLIHYWVRATRKPGQKPIEFASESVAGSENPMVKGTGADWAAGIPARPETQENRFN